MALQKIGSRTADAGTVRGPKAAPQPKGPPLASNGSLKLYVPKCDKGLGSLINSPASPELIEGVRLQPQLLWPDDRGYFLEIQRFGQGLAAGFPPATTQVSAVLDYPETIKAFHYHLEHTDCWTPTAGLLQVVLVDLRAGSATFGRRNTMFVGDLRPWQILIPPGVAHGYKVISKECAVMVYLTDRFYDPKDEGRIPYNDPSINYDWEKQRK
jgi:dTDP-4-dehydrorhamnose 3,5-epimerase